MPAKELAHLADTHPLLKVGRRGIPLGRTNNESDESIKKQSACKLADIGGARHNAPF